MQGIINIFILVIVAIMAFFSAIGIPLIPVYGVLVFSGNAKRAQSAEDKLNDTMMKDETLLTKGIQQRVFAFASRRKLVGITTSRVIVIARGIFGGFTMQDFQWKDLKDVKLSENVLSQYCGSDLEFYTSTKDILIPGVVNEAAKVIYQKAQAEEQAWEEKQRVRGLEEKRAAAGGVTVNSGPSESGQGRFSVIEEIAKAKKLLDQNAISDAEFQEIKSKILSKNL